MPPLVTIHKDLALELLRVHHEVDHEVQQVVVIVVLAQVVAAHLCKECECHATSQSSS